MRIYLILTSYLLVLTAMNGALGSTASIPLNDTQFTMTPPADLAYEGRQIDVTEAFHLMRNGVDLSQLNPVASELWQNRKLSITPTFTGPDASEVMFFDSFKNAARENARLVLRLKSNPSQLFEANASIDNHAHILRAALLRLAGFDVDLPQYYPQMKIEFPTIEAAQEFIVAVGERTLILKERWVHEQNDKVVTIKGLILLPTSLRNVNAFIPVMSQERQETSRLFRSLLALYTLTDFPQEMNRITHSVGSVFNRHYNLNHPYADQFTHVMKEDLKWHIRRLQELRKIDIFNAVKLMGLPRDVSQLITELFLLRLNAMTRVLWPQNAWRVFPENSNINMGTVVNGRLTRDLPTENYVVDFYEEDPESPFRIRELFRLFSTQLTYSAISSTMDYVIERFVPGLRVGDAMQDIQSQMQEYREENPDGDGVLPIKMWSRPLVNGNIFARRNIVFGQVLGNNAPIQLVDSLGVEVNLGVHSAISGLPNNLLPTITAGVKFGRTYTHIRAMPDLRTAVRQRVRSLIIPLHLRKLGRIIQDDFECSLAENVWVEETEINGQTVYLLKYDEALPNGRELAVAKRSELIASGTPEGSILMQPDNRSARCESDVTTRRNDNVREFLEQFAQDETFIITDTIRLSERNNLPISIPTAAGQPVSINLGNENAGVILRNIYIRRTSTGFDITVQRQRNISATFETGLRFYLEIFRHSSQRLRGFAFTKVYKIKIDEVSDEIKQVALSSIREILVHSDHDMLKEHYPPYELDHDAQMRLHTFKLFFFKIDRLKYDHEVDVVVPNPEGQELPLSDRTRKFFFTLDARRRGVDYYNYADRLLSSYVSFLSLGSSDSDPGISPFGRSKKEYYSTEVELTTREPENMVTKIEYTRTGWKMRRRPFMRLLNDVEDIFNGLSSYRVIDRGPLHDVRRIRSYNVKTTLLIYPSAIEKILNVLKHPQVGHTIRLLKPIFGEEEWNELCNPSGSRFQYHFQQNMIRRYGQCVPHSVSALLRYRDIHLNLYNRKEKAKSVNKLVKKLFEDFNKNKVLRFLGEQHFFANIRITGYREHHVAGAMEYISNSLGRYDPILKTGPIDNINSWIDINSFEFRGMFYAPGF